MFLMGMYCWLVSRIASLREDERGAAAVEYGLLVALIALFIVGAVGILGNKIQGVFCQVVTGLPFGPTTCP